MKTEQKTKKDFFDILSSLSGVFIALAGFLATYVYNNNQIEIQKAKVNADNKISQITLIEKCMKYVTSTNQNEREFGYFVFQESGYEKLALKLITLKADPAGTKVIQNIASDTNSKFNTEAKTIIKKQENAQTSEANGFRFLLEKDIDNAIISFTKSENFYNGFHQVYEISRYLKQNKNKLTDKDFKSWNEVYLKVLKDFSWGMPKDIKLELIEKSKQIEPL